MRAVECFANPQQCESRLEDQNRCQLTACFLSSCPLIFNPLIFAAENAVPLFPLYPKLPSLEQPGLRVLRCDGRERITLGRDFHCGTEHKSQETHPLLDNEQEWIEKYRAALVQQPPSRRLRLAAALNSLAKALGFAIGKTSGKRGNPVQSVVSSQPTEPEVQEHSRTQSHSREQSASKKASPPEHQQDKKAS
jgi:hypothetical protein